jgi:probable rRNA maturation factor
LIETALQAQTCWPDHDWDGLAKAVVDATINESPYLALKDVDSVFEIAIRLSDDAEVRTLNRDYRHKDEPTNVLSFPMVDPGQIGALASTPDEEVLLGDIVLARETCVREAAARAISVESHATHLIVHGTLHLLGYDHMRDDEAEAMESLERRIMAKLGLHDPYEPVED